VLAILSHHLATAAKSQTVLATPEASTAALLSTRITALIEHLKAKGARALPEILLSVIVCAKEVHLTLSSDSLMDWLSIAPGDYAEEFLSFTAPLTIRRRGVETRIATGEEIPAPDATLLRILAQAHVWAERLRTGTPLAEVAAEARHSTSYIRTRAPLAFLSPTIQKHVLAGTQPIDLTLAGLIRSKIPFCWREQERIFGFSEA
jgi:hypothetical protein